MLKTFVYISMMLNVKNTLTRRECDFNATLTKMRPKSNKLHTQEAAKRIRSIRKNLNYEKD
jgi:hypothetical protein